MNPGMMARVLFRSLSPNRSRSGTDKANRDRKKPVAKMTEAV
jgi:hypothetical protein